MKLEKRKLGKFQSSADVMLGLSARMQNNLADRAAGESPAGRSRGAAQF
jgi:hypothetical protein